VDLEGLAYKCHLL